MSAANMFSDTNILIYAYSTTELTKKTVATEVLKHPLHISIQVINEFHWVMHHKYHVSFEQLHTINRAFFTLYHVQQIGQATIELAFTIAQRYKYQYWDSLIIAAALEAECSILYSEDLQHGQTIEQRLTIMNPFM